MSFIKIHNSCANLEFKNTEMKNGRVHMVLGELRLFK